MKPVIKKAIPIIPEYIGVSIASVGMVMIGKRISEKIRITRLPEIEVVLAGD